MGALLVVVLHPVNKLDLYLLQRAIELLPKHHARGLAQHGLTETLKATAGQELPCLDPGTIDVHHSEVQFIARPLRCPAVVLATIDRDRVQCDLSRLEEQE